MEQGQVKDKIPADILVLERETQRLLGEIIGTSEK